jgi:predicted MFS family arabinose efflux permease
MVTGAICMNKVSPVLTNIASDLAISNSTQAGLLMSIFVLSGIFLSIPMGMLITKYGTFKTGIFSLAAIILGSMIGAKAGNYISLLISRLIEGIGLMFLATIGPNVVASSFSDQKRGTAMGLLMCFMSFGQIIALNLAPVMATSTSWRNFWWVSAGTGVVALILWLIFIKGIDNNETNGSNSNEGAGVALKDVLMNRSVWLVCVTFFTFMITHMGVFNYLPTYLTEVGGISTTLAGTLTSVASIIGIPVGIAGGMIADKCGSRKIPLGITMILLAVVIALIPLFKSANYLILLILYGIVSMSEAGLCFTAVTEVVRPVQVSTASAVLNTAQWIGAFLSTMIFGNLLDNFGWNISFYVMVPIALIGAISILSNKKLK